MVLLSWTTLFFVVKSEQAAGVFAMYCLFMKALRFWLMQVSVYSRWSKCNLPLGLCSKGKKVWCAEGENYCKALVCDDQSRTNMYVNIKQGDVGDGVFRSWKNLDRESGQQYEDIYEQESVYIYTLTINYIFMNILI